MRVIARDGEHEIEIHRSRFRCVVARIGDLEAASATIARVRKAGPGAHHHCTALRIGDPDSGMLIARSNDDGEPGGTAGVPMLEVLARRELTDVVAVVSRWFGGIKLGAGGLVRAYSGALAETLDLVGQLRRVRHRELLVTVPHDRAGRLGHDLRNSPYLLREVEYGADVTFTVAVADADVDAFEHWVAERCGGEAEAVDTGPLDLYLP
ncbi:IMPACT family protein [Prauserella muralis]|uniref:IMPACT family protein n=1 Tax=Prauserella muralis TaxID=588067 RepID=A0A2V4B0Q5_9PSEU|nr:YigZ family protein [Prauserella muralis]PXY27774.1 IMPACT family protein [Prauserella muralis]TWE22472.1 putative YigZ family protein [Prauserella muralis]